MQASCSTALLGAISLAASAPASALSTFSGTARAIDGDSLVIGDKEVRLHGIDAPEFSQTCSRNGQPWACGAVAADQLAKLVTGKQVQCTVVERDEHGRTVARCSAGSVDVNRAMVSSGYALAYRRYSFAYVSAEQAAKANKRGLWSGNFQLPSDYRHSDEPATSDARSPGPKIVTPGDRPVVRSKPKVIRGVSSKPQPTGGCAIKGNRGSNGWIYHLPGMPYYGKTVAEEIFCTEAEARAAGYRRAKVR